MNNKAVAETKRLKQELDQVKDRYGKQVRVFHLLKMKILFNTDSITEATNRYNFIFVMFIAELFEICFVSTVDK